MGHVAQERLAPAGDDGPRLGAREAREPGREKRPLRLLRPEELRDGRARFPEWTVYWKGLAPADIPAAIDWSLSRPVDIPHGDE